LKDLGLIDSEGKTQDLAKEWRDDERYPEVCNQLRKKIYPEDLLSAITNPAEDRQSVERWFANHTGSGTSAVRRMTQFYIILAEADASKRPETRNQTQKIIKKTKILKTAVSTKTTPPKTEEQVNPPPAGERSRLDPPGVNINIGIHISADSTPDQIDKIFESMAKHIYKS